MEIFGEDERLLFLKEDFRELLRNMLANDRFVQEKYGIAKGHIETIHSYTSDQNLLDNFHKKIIWWQ